MPKVKTHRGAAKRFSLTKTGKVKMNHAFRTHKFTSKSSRQKRALRKTGYVGPEARNIRSLIPYK